MSNTTTMRTTAEPSATKRFDLKGLMGSGHRIMLALAAALAIGLVLNRLFPTLFAVGELSSAAQVGVWAMLALGVVGWLWSVVLILTQVPKGELITTGPFAVVKHPLYTSIALLLIPAVGLLLGSWLGFVVGAVMYAASRAFAPAEEHALAATFGAEWDAYCDRVWIPWL